LDVRAEQDELEVEFVAKEKGIKINEASKEEEFIDALKEDERMEKMDLKAIKSTFDKVSCSFYQAHCYVN
jgi:pre-mRNA-processing factor 40